MKGAVCKFDVFSMTMMGKIKKIWTENQASSISYFLWEHRDKLSLLMCAPSCWQVKPETTNRSQISNLLKPEERPSPITKDMSLSWLRGSQAVLLPAHIPLQSFNTGLRVNSHTHPCQPSGMQASRKETMPNILHAFPYMCLFQFWNMSALKYCVIITIMWILLRDCVCFSEEPVLWPTVPWLAPPPSACDR